MKSLINIDKAFDKKENTGNLPLTFRVLGIIIKIATQGRFGRKLKGTGDGQHEALGTRIFQILTNKNFL